ncbi:MAG: gliding motility-associated C-terminal domain-containing protein [Bacteroidales bacterium]|nr:gliding motility-associated C-terminal domain-containing protein [Bacteroidales bacterium]
MKRYILFLVCTAVITCGFAQKGGMLRYEENKGQWDKEILFKGSFTQGRVYATLRGLSITVLDSNNVYFHPHGVERQTDGKEKFAVLGIYPYNSHAASVSTGEKMSGYTNYFLGNDKSKHACDVRGFESITYNGVYPYVDWEISSQNSSPKHSYIVHPNGRTKDIKTLYKGAEEVFLRNGKLIVVTSCGEINEDSLIVFQYIDGKKVFIPAQYVIERTDSGFLVSYDVETFDPSADLVIDPGLIFSTYSGSHSDNWGMTSCYDKHYLMISGGITFGGEYPTTEGAYEKIFSGNADCVITKYDSTGQNMIFSTYLGGTLAEMPHSMVVNNNNEVVVFGTTGSKDFPITEGCYQKYFMGGDSLTYETSINYPKGIDIFITTLSAEGNKIISSTFMGGSENDGINITQEYAVTAFNKVYFGNDSLYANYGDCARGEITADKNNNIYIASCTFSNNFPVTTGSFQPASGGKQDAVVFKMDRNLSTLIYSSYLGGNSCDAAYSIDLDANNRAYVCGGTCSGNFPVKQGAYKTAFNGGTTDAFVALVSANGMVLEACTYFGSDQYDQAFFVRLDKEYTPYIFGQTKAKGSALIHNAQYAKPGSGQFVAKLGKNLDTLIFSTVFGTGDNRINISPSGFNIDMCGRIYCAGWGRQFKYILSQQPLGTFDLETTADAYMKTTDGADFYIMCMEKDATALNYATFFGEKSEVAYQGNDHVDGGTSRFDRYGAFYLTVCASCNGTNGFPVTSGAYSTTNNATNCNMSSTKFSINNDFAVADFETLPVSCSQSELSFKNYSRGESFVWDFGDGSAKVNLKNPTHKYNNAGLYTVTMSAYSQNGCQTSDTVAKNVLILNNSAWFADTLTTCEQKPLHIGFENLALYDGGDVTFSWSPASLLNDSTGSNPYAVVSSPTLFTVTVTSGGCTDTIYRFVDIDTMESYLPDTLHFCSLPYTYTLPDVMNRTFECSWTQDFNKPILLSQNNTAVTVDDTAHKRLYVRFYANGCMGQDSIILDYSGPEVTLTYQNEGCAGQNNGWAEITCNYTSNIHYQWSCSDKDTNFVGNLPQGSYTVKVYNNDDACTVTKSFNISASQAVAFSSAITDAKCNTVCNGGVNIIPTMGVAPFSYLWNTGQDTSFIKDLCQGEYTVTVTDNNNCSLTKTITVGVQDTVLIAFDKTINPCPEGCSAKINTTVSGGETPYYYSWSNQKQTKNIEDLCSGVYTLTVTDKNGCSAVDSTEITYEDKLADIEVSVDPVHIYDGQTITLSSTYIPGFKYSWTPSKHLKTPQSNTTKGTAYENTVFYVDVFDGKGCKKSDSVSVEVEYVQCGKPNIFVPNAFTPNADGKNDIVCVSGEYIESVDFRIYDRWGECVFATEKNEDCWDGKYRNNECSSGVYFYKLEVHCMGGKTYVSGGDITLIR